MPIYEYQCPACNATFEKQQSITAPPIKTCPECGGRKVQRLISSTSFVLKGSGWYVTDYARKDAKGAKGSESKAPDSTSKTETKSETKADSAATKETAGSTKSASSNATASS